jgi:hypothetical protein
MRRWRSYHAAAALLVLAIGAATVAVSSGGHGDAGSIAFEGEHEQIVFRGATACGVERWSVKTGLDRDARLVNARTSIPSTIGALRSLAAPIFPPLTRRVRPTETTVFTVGATLLRYRTEGDSDIHLVIADSGGRTMIAEIPHPDCVGVSSPFLQAIRTTRRSFDSRFHPQPFWQRPNIKVQVTGVGFFDFKHGQSGVAPNAIELHPVLRLQLGGSQRPPSAPPTVVPASGTIHVSARISDASPARFSLVTVFGHITQSGRGVPNVPVTAIWHYKTTTSSCSSVSDAGGTASCTRNIYRATIGFVVVVDVDFLYGGNTYRAQTSFTPA